MKKFLILIIFSLFSTQAISSSKDCTKLAIIDRDKIISESLVFQDIKKQIEVEKSNLQESSSKQEKELRKIEQELSKQQGILSEEAFNQKAQDFNQSVMTAQQDISAKSVKLEEFYLTAVENVYNLVRNIANRIAKEENIDLILFVSKKNQVFYSKDQADISDKVIKMLNKEAPHFNMKQS